VTREPVNDGTFAVAEAADTGFCCLLFDGDDGDDDDDDDDLDLDRRLGVSKPSVATTSPSRGERGDGAEGCRGGVGACHELTKN